MVSPPIHVTLDEKGEDASGKEMLVTERKAGSAGICESIGLSKLNQNSPTLGEFCVANIVSVIVPKEPTAVNSNPTSVLDLY